MSDAFDIVVVGAGSSGCVLANRLSVDPSRRVLLLEAGGTSRHPLMALPAAWLPLSNDPSVGWGYASEPEPQTLNRTLPQPRGKVLGGTSSINGLMNSRGAPGDYDGWAAMGLAGWSYAEVLPYFKRAEASWRGDGPHHGAAGPMSVVANRRDPVIFPAMIEAGRRLGYRQVEDFNGAEQEGFGMPDFNFRRGRRESTATAYLRPIGGRSNLKIETDALAARVLVEARRATGVEYLKDGERRVVRAGEVILSGGAFNSPQLLMLSGIGPADALKSVAIDPILDLPGVGRNLQDHPLLPMSYEASGPYGFDRELRLDRLALASVRWALQGQGPLAEAPLSVQAFLRLHPDSALPDTQFHASHVSMTARPWFPGWRAGAGYQFAAAALQLHPHSKGEVTLRSADPRDPPRIRLGLLTDDADRRFARDMLRFIRRFFAADPVAALIRAELAPGPAIQSDEDIDSFVRAAIQTGMHPTSSCAMGLGPQAVVDASLSVHGLEGLRVVDASVMPTIVGGNTNAPTIMIAEKASDMILRRSPPAASGRAQQALEEARRPALRRRQLATD